jgi:hypothetical protein
LHCALHGRRVAGPDLSKEYLAIASDRIAQAKAGLLPRRPRGKEVYVPGPNDKITKHPIEFGETINGKNHPIVGELPFLDNQAIT